MIESSLLTQLHGFIDGQWRGGHGGETIDVVNPATGELLARVPDMGALEARSAVDTADGAMRSAPSVQQRRSWLHAIVGMLQQHRDELARIITLEQGKPLKESAVEVDYSAGFFRFAADQLDHLSAQPLPAPIKNHRWTIHHRPAGVAALITPWNFPLAMLAKKLSAAIGAGCAIVAKPAELTPLTCIALWQLLARLDFPPGFVNLVIGRPEPIGDVLCSHPAVRIVSFTGSTATGRMLIAKSAPHIKRLALELGGNAPYVVFDDADINLAADALMANKFRCAGQTCVCANRILVHDRIEQGFIDAVTQRVRRIHVGNGLDPQTDIGPLINARAVEKVRQHIDDAVQHRAQCVLGGDAKGQFFAPTILRGVTPQMLLSREETFGPVIAIGTFHDEEQAIELANGTPYGLAAYVFSRDAARIERVTARLRFGHVGVNTGMGPTPEAPFGGMKQSGFGREGGVEGLLEFCETQTVVAL
ncbi:MAG TPA: NAD-dependent succinate-semialdehyde dehydrogenase [Tepidisphaeraceae bacterium]|nr:NAD-dependent succinate-semialdehyde dehydrogenase [Tepidisphaeraceae bacterium]